MRDQRRAEGGVAELPRADPQARNALRARLLGALGLDPDEETPGRSIVRSLGQALVDAMKQALAGGDAEAAQIVACRMRRAGRDQGPRRLGADRQMRGAASTRSTAHALKAAYDEVEDQEDEHLYHTKGWCRELWIQSLGMPAVLPPPEERQHVKTAIGAAKAEQMRDQLA